MPNAHEVANAVPWKAACVRRVSSKCAVVVAAAAVLSACTSAGFVSSWKAPDAQPLEFRGTKVAAVVMMSGDASRRAAEDKLASEITARGAQGIAMYVLLPGTKPGDEAAARAALEKAGVSGAVVMRPVGVEKDVSVTPVTYGDPMHRNFWGGYYAYGWGGTFAPMTSGGDVRTDTIVVVETMVYSLKQNKLVWAGQSRTTNPENVDALIEKLAGAAAKELKKLGLIGHATAS